MLFQIISKELKGYLIGLRFFLTLTLTLVMMIAGTIIFAGQYNHKWNEFRDIQNKNLTELSTQAQNLANVAFCLQPLQLKPTPLELIAEGGIKNVPNTFNVTAFDVSEPQSVSAENNFMRRFKDVDWTFVFAFVLSFFAVLATYDTVSGEKSSGTLSLMLSNAVSRNTVLVGKYLSALINISIPLSAGILLSLLIAAIFGRVEFVAADLGKIVIFIVSSLSYLSIFILLGMLVTSLTKNSITSIIICLFIWVLVAVLIPGSGGKIAAKLFPIPTLEQVDRQISNRQTEIRQAALAHNPKTFAWTGDIFYEHLPDRAAAYNAMADARIQINNEYMFRRIGQVRNAASILKMSPTSVFTNLAEQVCQTGIDRYENFYRQAFEYRKQLRQFIIEKDKLDADVPHLVYEADAGRTISQKPVDANAIPKFEERALPFGKSLRKALSGFAILIGFNILLFIFVYGAFHVYDVR